MASNPSKKYTYRSEAKQIGFRVSKSEFANECTGFRESLGYISQYIALICVLRRF